VTALSAGTCRKEKARTSVAGTVDVISAVSHEPRNRRARLVFFFTLSSCYFTTTVISTVQSVARRLIVARPAATYRAGLFLRLHLFRLFSRGT